MLPAVLSGKSPGCNYARTLHSGDGSEINANTVPAALAQHVFFKQHRWYGVENDPVSAEASYNFLDIFSSETEGSDHGSVGFLSRRNGHIGAQCLKKSGKTLSNPSPSEYQNGTASEHCRKLASGDPQGAIGGDGGVFGKVQRILQKVQFAV